ncbi:hypothetical protein J6590_020020 [Homalodisca vitripennis]|nr:hypothetical protein J6590_020020 [Homalodisca vitripennis]
MPWEKVLLIIDVRGGTSSSEQPFKRTDEMSSTPAEGFCLSSPNIATLQTTPTSMKHSEKIIRSLSYK